MNPNTPNDATDPAVVLPDAAPIDIGWMALHSITLSLKAAQSSALAAMFTLEGTCRARAKELAQLIADAQCFAERLALVVTGDMGAANPDGLTPS